MIRVPISIAIAIACLWSEVAAAISEAGACPSLLQHGKQHSLASSEVDSCPRIMQRLQAFDSSDLLNACKTALADTALCLEAEQELRREGKPCDILGPVWGQLQDQTRVLLLERRSRKRMSAVHERSLVKRSDSNRKDVDAAATSDGNTTKGNDSANATSKTNSTSNGTADQSSSDGRRRRKEKSRDAWKEVWDKLLNDKLDYDHAQTEPIPSNDSANENVSNASAASTADNNADREDSVPSNATKVANSKRSAR